MKSTFLYKFMTLVIIFIAILSVKGSTQSNNNTEIIPKYSEVRISLTSPAEVQKLLTSGVVIDHAIRKPGHYMDAWISHEEVAMLRSAGVSFTVKVADWQTYYDNLPKMNPGEIDAAIQESADNFNVSHNIYGTMGGFMKYNEVVNKLDSMRIQYPSLISTKFSIGTTWEGRSIWTVRLTKNPDAVTGKPQAWYHAVIHAREPEAMEQNIYYMYWLLENYNIDPVATYILNNRELYFTPILNPDGYVRNEITNPNGGGMWRANRHGTGNCGYVDPNRNFGLYQYWNSPNGGSSIDSCAGGSGTYRGKHPFSELETQAAMNFINTHNINVVMGAHTYGNLLIKPWAWQDPIGTPHDFMFNEYLADMKADNNYTTGFASQTVLYEVRGGADDWYYTDSTHPGHNIIAMTPETGTTGFWPTQAEIIPLAQGMLFSNKYMSLVAGAYVGPTAVNLNKANYVQSEAGNLKVKFKNKGVLTANNIKVQLSSTSPYITIPQTEYTYSSLATFAQDSSTFNFTVAAGAPNNYAIPISLKIKLDTGTVHSETKYVLVGSGVTTLADSAEQTFSKWTTSNTWAITTAQSHTPTHSFTDSPGNYGNNSNNSMTLVTPVNVSSMPVVYLSFWHRYVTEAGYDLCKVEVSSNNGTSWQTAKTYSGSQTTWTAQSLDITQYANASANLKIRFLLATDAGQVYDGWYVDDIKLTNYSSSITSVGNVNGIPEVYSLSQNYPNPFNPSTSISYSIPVKGLVTIKIFDILGQEAAQIVNEVKDPGSYSINFNASSLSSGIYYYRIQSGSFTETRKMMLIK